MAPMKEQKVLLHRVASSWQIILMGKSGSGKTSMRSVIFTDYSVRDTWKLIPTMKVDKNPIRLFGNVDLQLWDCGGQDSVVKNYLGERAEEIFTNAAAMVYVIDISGTRNDDPNFEDCTVMLRRYSSEAKLFVLLHKSDLLDSHSPLRETEARLRRIALPSLATCHYTSIWDESIYRAWSNIVSSLLPHLTSIQAELNRFSDRFRCQETIIFEARTFLVLCYSSRRHHIDPRRFEKISNILKQVRMITGKFNSSPTSLKLILEDGTGILLDQLSPDALLLLVTHSATDGRIDELFNQISNFKPVLTTLVGTDVDVDPHMI